MLNRFDLNLLAALDALVHEKNVTAPSRGSTRQPQTAACGSWSRISSGRVLAQAARRVQADRQENGE
jgi:hypothetical protein